MGKVLYTEKKNYDIYKWIKVKLTPVTSSKTLIFLFLDVCDKNWL